MHIEPIDFRCTLSQASWPSRRQTDPVTSAPALPPTVPQSATAGDRAVRSRDRAVVALAALSGATDALGLLALGGSFTSVMTGNLVLVGVGVGTHDLSALGVTATAIACYTLGVFVGARIVGEHERADGPWPHQVTRGLLVELALLLVFAVVWWAQGGHPRHELLAPLLGLNAVALGIQSSVIIRFGVSGLSTTYMTGTLTTMVARLAARQPLASVGRPGALLAALVAGAAAAGAACIEARALVPVLQLLLLGGAVVTGLRLRRDAGAAER